MFNKLDKYGSSTLGLISGLMIGVVVVSLYFIYTYDLGLFQFLPPIILAILAAILIFIHIIYKFPSTASNFLSGIIIVLSALFIFIDFRNQLNSTTGQTITLLSIILTIVSFFSIIFLMKAIEIKMLTEPQKEMLPHNEMPLSVEKKQKEHPKPPIDRL